ncbi:hypothetical protein AMJAP_0271 [Amphritea japonica ATCC BAA-1530]|uniref:Uncharacterized protein n=2 Tax=Amphritea TaxID=515417 RepID=A0A7R6SRK2_9GAMM|nr:hypothetical protein AMJAP_0271 [Amphritea japonica ATCC BAA-1530]
MDDGFLMKNRNNPKLHKTFYFWLALFSPILIALDLAFVISFFSPELIFGFSASQINTLLIELKLPIAIAGLSIPFVAMVASIHRSSQTARQIDVQSNQNIFSNHFKHLEEFKKSYSEDAPKGWVSIESFYKDIYPNTILGSFTPNLPDIDPNIIIKQLYHDVENEPLELLNFCTERYSSIFHKMDVYLDLENIPYIKPSDILELFSKVHLAITLHGLHPSPYIITIESEVLIRELDRMYQVYDECWGNIDFIEGALTSIDVPDLYSHINSSLVLNRSSLYTGLAIAYVWYYALSATNRMLMLENMTLEKKEYMETTIASIRSMTLNEYNKFFDGQTGTIKTRYGITY